MGRDYDLQQQGKDNVFWWNWEEVSKFIWESSYELHHKESLIIPHRVKSCVIALINNLSVYFADSVGDICVNSWDSWEELKRLRVEIIINTMERDFKHEVFSDLPMGWNRVAGYARRLARCYRIVRVFTATLWRTKSKWWDWEEMPNVFEQFLLITA